jgi:hypothetical protein
MGMKNKDSYTVIVFAAVTCMLLAGTFLVVLDIVTGIRPADASIWKWAIHYAAWMGFGCFALYMAAALFFLRRRW